MSSFFQRLNAVNGPSIGLGCMNLSHGYGQQVPEQDALRTLGAAFDMGYRHFDTATLYGATANETLLGRALKGKREHILLASKCGMAIDPASAKRVIDGRPATLRRQCDASLKRLQTDHIDIYYLHRLDRQVPIEESVGALARLVDEGKLGSIGLSEISADTLRRARREAPIAAVQSEYSLWTRNPEIALLSACREAETALVAFSPLGRGFLAEAINDPSGLPEGDMRRHMPRFSPENFAHNRALLGGVTRLAETLGVTSAQLVLAWVKAQGRDVIPIPGSTSIAHIRDNLAAETLSLDATTCQQLTAMMTPDQVAGGRYSDAQQADIDTEEFPAAQ